MDNRASVVITAYITGVESIVRNGNSFSMPTGKITKANGNGAIFSINSLIDKLRADGSTRMFRAKINAALDRIIPVQIPVDLR